MYIYFDDSKLTYLVVLVGFFYYTGTYRQKNSNMFLNKPSFGECYALDSV